MLLQFFEATTWPMFSRKNLSEAPSRSAWMLRTYARHVEIGGGSKCNLYNVTTTREAVLQFTKAIRDHAGWNEASLDVYPAIRRLLSGGRRRAREIARAKPGECHHRLPM